MTHDPAPMAAAPFVWRPDGRPDGRAMWERFCDLALHGGPPRRGLRYTPARPFRATIHTKDGQSHTKQSCREVRP
jgi:hypothetical protein